MPDLASSPYFRELDEKLWTAADRILRLARPLCGDTRLIKLRCEAQRASARSHAQHQIDLANFRRAHRPHGLSFQHSDLHAKDIGEAYINQHVALARPSDEVNPRFLAWLLASKPTKAQWKLLQRGAPKVGLGLDDIRAVHLGLPPLAEQHQIVAEVEARTTAIALN